MKTLLIIFILGISTSTIFGQKTNLFERDVNQGLFFKDFKESKESDLTYLPELEFNNPVELNYVKFHSEITVFTPKGIHPFVIYPFDPKVQGYLRVFYPR
jgi:hypothetical protein